MWKNPIVLLEKIPYKKYKALERSKTFLEQLDKIEASFNQYMKMREKLTGPRVAYFSMEYGLDLDAEDIFRRPGNPCRGLPERIIRQGFP